MCRPREEISKHQLPLMKLNNLIIDIKLHFSGVKPMTETDIEKIDRYADEIREDLEKCKAFDGLKY